VSDLSSFLTAHQHNMAVLNFTVSTFWPSCLSRVT